MSTAGSMDKGHMKPVSRNMPSTSLPIPACEEVPMQVMVPESVRRQVALMCADRGESMRAVVLKGLSALGIDISDAELNDRRGRRRVASGGRDGSQ